MKLQNRILLLPAIAGLAFAISLATSLRLGLGLDASVNRIVRVHEPMERQLLAFDRESERVQLLRLAKQDESAGKHLDGASKAVQAISSIPGQSDAARQLDQILRAFAGASGQGSVNAYASLHAVTRQLDGANEHAAVSVKSDVRDKTQLLVLSGLLSGALTLVLLGVVSWLTLRSTWRTLGAEPDELRALAQQVALGDLSVSSDSLSLKHRDDQSLAAALIDMAGQLRGTVGAIRSAAQSIATASVEIASGNNDLSVRTEQTAASLQEASATMASLSAVVQQGAESAQEAEALANVAGVQAAQGREVMIHAVASMQKISAASVRIGDIVGVIEGIAFQTNILALNAAVEAAGAGDSGRGFAAVASEVRTLAQRSATAAREIKTVIEASSQCVTEGSALVLNAGDSMNEVTSSIERLTQRVGSISRSAHGQASNIQKVGGAVQQIDQMTQQNAALVEQSAAAAESLRDQAERLTVSMAGFRLAAPAA